eukprot:1337564-Pleurochrysis_carterae.AAC.3
MLYIQKLNDMYRTMQNNMVAEQYAYGNIGQFAYFDDNTLAKTWQSVDQAQITIVHILNGICKTDCLHAANEGSWE